MSVVLVDGLLRICTLLHTAGGVLEESLVFLAEVPADGAEVLGAGGGVSMCCGGVGVAVWEWVCGDGKGEGEHGGGGGVVGMVWAEGGGGDMPVAQLGGGRWCLNSSKGRRTWPTSRKGTVRWHGKWNE